MDGDVDAVVGGIGTAGTMTGLGRYFRKVAPGLKMILADPVGSLLAPYVQTGELTEPGAWVVEGIGEDELPPIGDMSLIDEAIIVSDRDSLLTARDLLKAEGIMGGSSTGTIVAAALQWCRRQTEAKRVVAIVPDGGDKYLSKMYDDHWMADQGFVERKTYGDLRDLIARLARRARGYHRPARHHAGDRARQDAAVQHFPASRGAGGPDHRPDRRIGPCSSGSWPTPACRERSAIRSRRR